MIILLDKFAVIAYEVFRLRVARNLLERGDCRQQIFIHAIIRPERVLKVSSGIIFFNC